MSLHSFLLQKKNLFDLENTEEARKNLGLGTMALYNSDNVSISGGNIIANQFRLKNGNPNLNSYLRAIDNHGTCEWYDIPAFNWLNETQQDILLSGFSNDCSYVRLESLCNIAFTGSVNDLENFPTDLHSYYTHDNLSFQLLFRESNLSDLNDIVSARSNLGLGDIALQNSNNLHIDKLTISSSLRLNNSDIIDQEYLYLSANKVISKALPIGLPDSDILGLVKTTDANVDRNDTVPTSKVLYQQISDLQDIIESSLNIINNNELLDLVKRANVILSKSNLSDLSDISEARENLGLGSLALQNSNSVRVSNIEIDGLRFEKNAGINKVLKSDSSGNAYWDYIPNAGKFQTGVVFTSSDIFDNTIPAVFKSYTVPTTQAVSDLYTTISNRIDDFNNNIFTDISQLDNFDKYLFKENNLSELNTSSRKSEARNNLGLHKVASTGNYNDLDNRNTKLSEFMNDSHFLVASSNLKEFDNDKESVRMNLGLGTLATQDSNNVNINGGVAMFSNVNITDRLLYKSNTNVQGKVLQSIDPNGRVAWRDFPVATSTKYGAVKISHDEDDDDHDAVPSCSLVQKLYTKLLEDLRRV